MDRRRFLKALGFGAVAPAMVQPLMDQLRLQGIAPDVEALLEPVQMQPPLPQSKLIEIYHQTLKDMGVHNEAIDRMTGRWEELEQRQATIKAAKLQHAERVRKAQQAGKLLRRRKRRDAIRRRIKHLRRTPKPKLP